MTRPSLNEAKAFATRENIPRNAFEFQMLHGIRRDLQQSLVKEGWGVRVYIPFGTEWYPYFMRAAGRAPGQRVLHRKEHPAAVNLLTSIS